MNYISTQELASLMAARCALIVDARNDERAGGWIPGSVHLPASEAKEDDLREIARIAAEQGQTVVFHCQYSQVRGPTLARMFRRTVGEHPPLAILSGGFINWQTAFPDRVDR